jgi:hypothetical protein
MWFALVVLAAYLFLDPNAGSMINMGLNRVVNLIDGQFQVFFTAVALTLLASAISWFMARLPKRQARPEFRVVRRYRVQE